MTDHEFEEALAQLGAEVRGLARDVPGPLPGPLRRVRLSAGQAAVEIEWHVPDAEPPVRRPSGDPSAAVRAVADGPVTDERAAAEQGQVVTSPMVGTFYRAESEGAAPFVAVGDIVEAGQTIGIVEAMKLFNPIVADCAGVVLEVLAENGKPVQYGDPLVRLGSTDLQPVGG